MPNNSSVPESKLPPLPPEDPNEFRFDKESAFQLYAVFCGDVDRTAHALDVDAEIVRNLAKAHEWDRKLKPIIDLKASTRAGDVERAINRAINFTQVHRFRMFNERVLRQLTGLAPHTLEAFLFPTRLQRNKLGEGEVLQVFSTRALADLASALEKCHTMSYLALNDTATERKERKETGDDEASATEMHVKLAAAMAASGGKSKTIPGMLADAQLQIAQETARVDLTPSVD